MSVAAVSGVVGVDAADLVALARDPRRHAFLLRTTGSDYAAQAEIAAAQRLLAGQDEPDLRALLELAVYRNAMSLRNQCLPSGSPAYGPSSAASIMPRRWPGPSPTTTPGRRHSKTWPPQQPRPARPPRPASMPRRRRRWTWRPRPSGSATWTTPRRRPA